VVTLLAYNTEVAPSTNLGGETDYPNRCFFVDFLSLSTYVLA